MPEIVPTPTSPNAPPPPQAAPTTAAPPVPVPVQPVPASAPRVNEAEKTLREGQLRLRQQQDAFTRQQQQFQAEQQRILTQTQAEQQRLQQARQLGTKDLGALFEAHGVSSPSDQAKLLSDLQMQLMRDGKISPAADAPVGRLEQRLSQFEQRFQAREAELAERERKMEEAAAEARQQQWYGNLQRQTALTADCKLTRVPYLMTALDQELQKYEQETQLDYGPVFAEKVREVESQLATQLAEQGYFRVDGDTIYAADGSVKGKVTAATAALGAAPGQPIAQPVQPGTQPLPGAAPTSEGLPVPNEDEVRLARGIGSPHPRRPPAMQSLDPADGAAPGAPVVFGRVKSRDTRTAADEYNDLVRGLNANPNRPPQ